MAEPGDGTHASLVATRDASDPSWELRPDRRGRDNSLLIGWPRRDHAVDAGVPGDVALLLARALCGLGSLTFPHPMAYAFNPGPEWRPVLGGLACVLVPDPWRDRPSSHRLPLICTSDPEVARTLFDAEGFSWELLSQVAVLTLGQLVPARLDFSRWKALIERSGRDLERSLTEAGVTAILTPGVDGDVAELITLPPLSYEDVEARLDEECARAGVTFRVVPESSFERALSAGHAE